MTIFLLALSISLDSLGIGVSYGLKRVTISTASLIIIVSMTLGVLSFTWLTGHLILEYLSLQAAKYISSLLLFGLGVTFILQGRREALERLEEDTKSDPKTNPHTLLEVIRSPEKGDMDSSGTIDTKEAFYLGAALSVDAITIGLVSAAYQISLPVFLIATAMINASLLRTGEYLGRRSSKLIPEGRLKAVSGSMIILMSLIKLL